MRRVDRLRSLRRVAVRAFDLIVRPDGSPVAKASSFAVGVFIGCLPLYGLHLVLSALAARLSRLSLLRIYLGAHVNNPLTAAPLIYLQLGLGNLLTGRPWPVSVPGSLGEIDASAVMVSLVVGSLTSGIVLAACTLGITLRLARRWERAPEEARELEEAARHFLDAGIGSWGFARGKLRHDPLYGMLARDRDVLRATRILDLGCGIGLVLARLHERDRAAGPARVREYLGLDASRRSIAVARKCLGRWGRFRQADIATRELPPADVILLADVLHYLPREQQDAVLERAAGCLTPGGMVLLREADAGAGWRFRLTSGSERLRAMLRGQWRRSFAYRTQEAWAESLRRLGLEVSWEAADRGTPFANVLLTARRATGGAS